MQIYISFVSGFFCSVCLQTAVPWGIVDIGRSPAERCATMAGRHRRNMYRVPTHLENSWNIVNLENSWNFMLDLEFLV